MQILRTFEIENSQNEKTVLKTRIQTTEKIQKIKRLKKHLIRIEK